MAPRGQSGGGFVETSSPTALGQLFVVYNDAQGISVAQIDEATAEVVQRVPVAAGFSLDSSALLSGPLNAAMSDKPELGRRGVPGMDAGKLFKVSIARAHLREAGIGPVTDTGGISANTDASPTLVYLSANSTAVEPYVAVGTKTGRVLTFSVALLAPGPSHAAGGQGDSVMTPSVPVTPSGLPPGAEDSGVDAASHLFVASTDGQTTHLHRLTRPDNGLRFAVADSPRLPGGAAVALATNQVSAPEGPAPGLVYVATSTNLYALDATNLTVQAQFSPTDLPAGMGFAHTAPAVAGNSIFVARDNGEQLVLDAHTLQPLPPTLFRQDPGNDGAKASLGQPAISHRYVQFGSDRGLFVYQMESPPPAK